MTISSTTVKNSYSGNDSTTAFAYTFKIFANTDLQVIIRSSTGTETVKTLTTHYTVSGVGDASGGNVTFTSGNTPATGETVVIRRAVPQTQAIDYIANDPFPAESHEEGLDRATMTTQQMQEELDRSFKVSRTNTITSSEFTDDASTRASKALGFDSDGNLTTVANFLPAGGDSAEFQYSTTTTDSDPGAGKFRLNNTTIASATEMYIDDLEFNGTDVSEWIQSWDDVTGNDTNRGRIRISKSNTLDTWMVFKVTGAITDASGYSKISLSYIDTAGTFANDDRVFISFVASGEDGAIPGYFYKFDTGTSDADPGAGEIRFNNATYASVTEIYIDDADANGATTQTDTETWGSSTSTIKGFLHIVDINDSQTYARFKITAAVSDESGYNKITVAHLASNNTFSAADELSVHFTRTGLKGDTGSTGATGSTGSTGATGAAGTNSQLSMTFESTTSDADPGAGKIAFNNGTLSSVSILYVDDADDAGADISSFVQSWDDVSNSTARGIVTVTKEGTPSTYATFKVSGAVTDASGYTKVPVTHIVSAGSFSDDDGVGVHFSYSGADGSGDIEGVTAGTNLSGGGTSGTVTINLADASTSVKGAASFSSDNFAASSGAITIKDSGVATDEIQDNAVTLAKMAGGTDGNLITYDTNGDPAAVATGNSGQVLTSQGAGAAPVFADPSSGGTEWQSSIKTADFTAVANQGFWVNTASGDVVVTLPSSANVGDIVELADYSRSWGTHSVTLNDNGLNFQGTGSSVPVYNENGQHVVLVYSGSTKGWIPKLDSVVADKTQTILRFLNLAGGASGGANSGGGGGAGGLKQGTAVVTAGDVYTITIGGGGSGVSPNSAGNNGSSSSIRASSGGKIISVTTGGGGGGGWTGSEISAKAGGCGGGGGFNPATGGATGGFGTAGEGFDGGSNNTAGGGGTGEAGKNAPDDGGDGLVSGITGTATNFGGGGGGAPGDGGAGGGTDGVLPSGGSSAAAANSGSGSGGTDGGGTSGNGGSGVVILRVRTAAYPGTTTGSPTVTTDGEDSIIKFTGSGTYTA